MAHVIHGILSLYQTGMHVTFWLQELLWGSHIQTQSTRYCFILVFQLYLCFLVFPAQSSAPIQRFSTLCFHGFPISGGQGETPSCFERCWGGTTQVQVQTSQEGGKAEARLFQSYTMVEMDDVEDDKEDSQSFKKPKTRRGDSTWRKLSEVDLRQEWWLATLFPRQHPHPSLPPMFLARTRCGRSAASGANKSGYPDPAAAGAEVKDPPRKVFAGFGRSIDGPLAGHPTNPYAHGGWCLRVCPAGGLRRPLYRLVEVTCIKHLTMHIQML